MALASSVQDMVIHDRDVLPGGHTLRSRRAVRYMACAFTDRTCTSGLVPSRGSTGDCYDNQMTGSFWSRMPAALVNRKRWKACIELTNAVFVYSEILCNRLQRYTSLIILTRLNTNSATALSYP